MEIRKFKHQGNLEKCTLSKSVFTGKTTAYLIHSKFKNTYGQGFTEKDAIESLKIRLNQLKNPGVRYYETRL